MMRFLQSAIRSLAALALLISTLTGFSRSVQQASKSSSANWPMFGRDIVGTHYNPDEKILTPENISRLKPKWIFETGGDVSSQPIVVDGIVYFGSWDGKEYAVDARTGKKVWEYDCGIPSRATAAYDSGVVYFGDLAGRLHAVDAKTGTLKWSERIDPHPKAVVTSSPKVHQGRIYIGVSSHEEGEPRRQKDYSCCSFRGGVAVLDARTGKQLWRFYTIPEEPKKLGEDSSGRAILGPSGIAVWSSVGLDPAANRIYFTTGNQYSGEDTRLVDSIVAVTMDAGKLVWSYQARPSDVFVIGCRDCGPDFDFGTTPLPVRGPNDSKILGAAQKSGWVHAVDAASGAPVWKTEIGPGSALGGAQFGSATDGERLYVAQAHPMKGGAIVMLDGATGKILWNTPTPDKRPNYGPIVVTGLPENRLVFAGSTAGFIRAYDGKDGRILWEFDTGGAVGGGPTVVDGVLYIGSGYTFLRVGKPNNKLYAFSLDGL
jgi:polyvinyl alcohol dehydrogenase (cytochrome)